MLEGLNRLPACNDHLKPSIEGWKIIGQRGRTLRRLLLVAQGSSSSTKEIWTIRLVRMDAARRVNIAMPVWAGTGVVR